MNEIYNLFTIRYYRNNTANFDTQPVVVKFLNSKKPPFRAASIWFKRFINTMLIFNSVLLANYAVFAYILAIILARLALSLTNKQFSVFVLVKLQIAKSFVRLFIINIVPTGIAQISHQLSIPSSSSFSGLPTATVSLLSFIIGMISPGIPDIEVVVLMI